MHSRQMTKTKMTTALIQTLTPSQMKFCKLKEWAEWTMKLSKGKLKGWSLKLREWNNTMKKWITKSYLLSKQGIS